MCLLLLLLLLAEIVRSSNVVKSEYELRHIPVRLYVSVKAEWDAVVFAVSACRMLMQAMTWMDVILILSHATIRQMKTGENVFFYSETAPCGILVR